jgi:hypothetical protein
MHCLNTKCNVTFTYHIPTQLKHRLYEYRQWYTSLRILIIKVKIKYTYCLH